MGKLIEATHVALGGEQGTTGWAQPYLDDEFKAYTAKLLSQADKLLLGRVTYEGLSAAYTAMGAKITQAHSPFDKFVLRIIAMPKLVASRTLEGQLACHGTHVSSTEVRLSMSRSSSNALAITC